MNSHLSFSLGPVQTFVAQARRTRDLWVGSWLLSWLVESALAAAEQSAKQQISAEDCQVIIPYRTVKQHGVITSLKSPVGGIPNRFEMAFSGDNARQNAMDAAKAAEQALNKAWEKLAGNVYDTYVEPVVKLGNGTQDIWDRQVRNFWEISWVVGEPGAKQSTIGSLAGARKQFRNVSVTPEPGIKCSLMPTFQELSGYCDRRREEKAQDKFWTAVRQQEQVGRLNLGETERLCAITLIKRLAPHNLHAATGATFSNDQCHWPSTAFLAATPWLKQIENDPDRKSKADAHAKLAVSAGNYSNSEQPAAHKIGVTWAKVDGPVWFKSAIRNDEPGKEKDRKTKTDGNSNPRKGIINDLLTSLKDTYSDPNGNKDQPIPFYAIVLMDGDQMGKLLNALNNPQELSQGLVEFNQRVEKIINSHDGRTVYAGGDDVLALLPAKDALKAADNIRRAYQVSFKALGVEDNLATISAAVVYSHWKYPLRLALQTAHHLLDDVAKNQTGRDAVAIGTILSSGLNAVWSVPWDVYLGNASGSHSLERLLDHFDHNDNNESTTPAFNASYLYLLRDRFAQLLDDVRDEPGEFASFEAADSGNNLLYDLAHAEYRRRMTRAALKNTPPEKTQPLISQLMSLTWKWTRQTAQGSLANIEPDRTTFCFDGWRVARLLKQIEDGRAVDHD